MIFLNRFKWLLFIFFGFAFLPTFSVLADSSSHTSKPDLMLLKTYQGQTPLVGWVMSEKLDGMRGYWNGLAFISREGNPINAPAWFTANFPPFELDGELWTKRDGFANAVSIIRQQTPDERWHQVSYHVFEVPSQTGELFARLQVAKTYLAEHPIAWVFIIPQIKITSQAQFKAYFKEVVAHKGEGLVVRNPDTLYQTGRLSSALKVKPFDDAECLVKAILPGQGKYQDKMGALRCEMVDGKPLKVGSGFSDEERLHPPKIGETITFKYYGLTQNGNPRFPIFLRIRPTD